MSADDTGRVQLDRLRDAGLRVRQVPELLDVDTAADAERVARQAPGSRFAATLASLLPAETGPSQPSPGATIRPTGPAAALGVSTTGRKPPAGQPGGPRRVRRRSAGSRVPPAAGRPRSRAKPSPTDRTTRVVTTPTGRTDRAGRPRSRWPAAAAACANAATRQKCGRTRCTERRSPASADRCSSSMTGPTTASRVMAISPGMIRASRPTTMIRVVSRSARISEPQGSDRSTSRIPGPARVVPSTPRARCPPPRAPVFPFPAYPRAR